MRRVAMILAILAGCVRTAGAEVVLAHRAMSEPEMSEQRLRDVMLGRVTTWADGTPITLVLVDDQATAAAIEEVTGRDLAQLLRGWKRLVYSGGGAMPVVVHTAVAAIDEVRRRPGALVVLAADPHVADVRTAYVPRKR